MLRILSWNSNTGFEKMQSQDLPSFGHDVSPSMVSCASATPKRKRPLEPATLPASFSQAVKPPSSVDVQKSLPNSSSNASPVPNIAESPALRSVPAVTNPANDGKTGVESEIMSPEKVKSKEEAQLATMRQTISSQLSLEILLKHRELRLIDQELAKCQVALEQLRRCSEIPFPALQQPSEQVSLGKGSAVRKSSERHPARSPAPWGVTDGPYSRHYAKWLLSDPQFDGGEAELATPVSAASLYGRPTRGHYTDFAQLAGKTSRSQRALNSGLPAGFTEPKQKPTGPMILKRKSDGRMVKLVCPDCGRLDFGSAQGFINHCRIGHTRNFASHDAAAEGCGEPIELDENGTAKDVLPEKTVPVVPTVPTVPVAATPPTTPGPITTPSATAHPLVRSAHLISKDAPAKLLVKGGCIPKAERKASKVKKSAPVKSQCSGAPNLSEFLQHRGVDLNLRDAVADAKTKTELPEDTSDEDMELDSPLPTPTGNSRHPQVAGSKQPADQAGASRKSNIAQARRREGVKGSVASVNTANEDIHFHHFMPLIPSPTNESTQAPSLIDDDEEMDPQSPPSSDEIDDSDVHFHVRDDDHPEEGHELRGPEVPTTQPTTCAQPTAPAQPPMAARPQFPQSTNSKDRQLNFIVEHPQSEDQNDKKRRRIGQ
ncbi:hypothetical protein PMZ80_009865 [Knufia obscura]|uniref:AHC1-like C2H2 zinc-finger domain-containing protein n=2 Tax=Knufia TaxID=430999 RepID=A0AAN8EPH5_9EURO|nr:hypothetical protein PMZ80_009865 [Knufia obscura]KAK5955958.1 hypothetical protein OHC33_002531 [Knufia fluminis]